MFPIIPGNIARNIGRGILGAGQGLAGGALGVSAAMGRSHLGRGMMAGAAMGGAWGAVSADTSIMGGMLGGATMGAAGGLGFRMGRAGFGAYRGYQGIGQAMRMSATRDVISFARNGRASARFIGRGITNTRAFSKIRGLF